MSDHQDDDDRWDYCDGYRDPYYDDLFEPGEGLYYPGLELDDFYYSTEPEEPPFFEEQLRALDYETESSISLPARPGAAWNNDTATLLDWPRHGHRVQERQARIECAVSRRHQGIPKIREKRRTSRRAPHSRSNHDGRQDDPRRAWRREQARLAGRDN